MWGKTTSGIKYLQPIQQGRGKSTKNVWIEVAKLDNPLQFSTQEHPIDSSLENFTYCETENGD